MTAELRSPDGMPLASESHRSSFEATAAKIARRVELCRIPPAAVIPAIVVMLVLVADAQAVALIPLQESLVTSYHLSASQAAWTLSATSITTCAAVPTLTRLGDRYGLRRLFLVSLGFVTVGQLLCSVAGSFELLVVGRSVLGFSAGMALVFSLIRATSRNEHELNRNSGVITAGTGLGVGVAFLSGGLILRLHGSVSDMFWITAGLSALVLLLSWAFLPDAPVRTRSRVDWVGGALVGGTLVCLVLAISQGSSWGWTSAAVLSLIGIGTVLGAAWVSWELRAPAPMVDLRIVGRRTLWPAMVVYGIVGGLGSYTSLFVSGYVQAPAAAGYGMSGSPLMAGVYLLAISVPVGVGGFLAARVIRKLGMKTSLVASVAVTAADEAWYAYNHSSALEIVIGVFIVGAAYSVASTAATACYMTGARKGEYGMIASAGFTMNTLSQAVMPAVYVAVLTSRFTMVPGTQTLVPAASNYQWILVFAAVFAAVALGAAVLWQRPGFSHEYTEDAVALAGIAAEPD